MNDIEKKFSLLSQLDIITQNNYINNTYCEYCFNNIKFIVINHVYYYIKSLNKVKMQLEDDYLHCIVINDDDFKYDFEIKYDKIQEIIIQIE